MTGKLVFSVILRLIFGIVLVGALLFLPAGTLWFPNGWLLMGILFLPMILAGILLLMFDPARLKRRLQNREQQKGQAAVIAISALMFVLGFVVSGLNFRYQWHSLPAGVTVFATAVFLASYLLYGEVLRENPYLSRTVVVEEDQTLVDTGLYGIVRHPMYSATLPLFLSMPLVLGCGYAFLIFLGYPFLIVYRIRQEEALLERELSGYREYQQRVKYRLIPFLW